MNHTSHIFKALFAIPVAAALTFSACSDEWDDHYKPDGQQFISGQTLWEAIESNPELSNFASVVKATGFDRSLNGSQAFSVFAPVNNDFTQEEAQNLINTYTSEKNSGTRDNDNTTIKEFLRNHIALYNTSVSSDSKDSLVMMNGKYQVLTSSTFAGHNLLSKNQAYANGILYTIDGEAAYYPNVYEYLAKDADIDSVARFLNTYDKYEFNAAQSVPGEIIDGRTQYLDSVVTLSNQELHQNLGLIDSEDSTYWMVVPNNATWNRLVPEYEKYYQYDNSVDKHKRDSMTWANARFAIINGTTFSRTQNTDAALQDSAMSYLASSYSARELLYGSYALKYYQYDHPYAAGGIFDGTTAVACSNGRVLKASTWNFDPKTTFQQEEIVQGESGSRMDSVRQSSTTYPPTSHTVLSSNPYYNQVSGHAYVEFTPSGTSNQVLAYYSLPNLLSNFGYDIYVQTAPALAGDTLASDLERLPVKFRVYLRYQDENGKLDEPEKGAVNQKWITLDGANNTARHNFETRPDMVDVFKVGNNIKIPYTTIGTGSAPKVELIFETSSSNTEVNRRHTYNRILRIDAIRVVPHQEEDLK